VSVSAGEGYKESFVFQIMENSSAVKYAWDVPSYTLTVVTPAATKGSKGGTVLRGPQLSGVEHMWAKVVIYFGIEETLIWPNF
jgi:hypothetical protein